MIRKGQVQGIDKGDVRSQIEFVCQFFGVFASRESTDKEALALQIFATTQPF